MEKTSVARTRDKIPFLIVRELPKAGCDVISYSQGPIGPPDMKGGWVLVLTFRN